MIYFNFNGLQSDRLVVIPISYSETATAEDPQVLDVEIFVEGQAFFDTSGDRDDAFDELEAYFGIESGSFSILYKNDDGNLIPSTIRISSNECTEPPTVVDFTTSGDEFSFRVIAKRQLPQRLNDSFVVARDLTFSVAGSGGAGTGTTFDRLRNQWTAFSVGLTGTISLNGWHENAVELSFFGTMRSDSPFMTLVSTDVDGGIVTRVMATDVTVERPIVRISAIPLDDTKCAFARTDSVSVDETVSGVQPIAGSDESVAEPLTYIGLIHTVAGGSSESTSVGTALLNLQFSQFYAGREFQLFGIEATSSITSGLGTYASLASEQTLTGANASFTVDSSGEASIDVTSIVQELVNLSGWLTSSPFQFWIADSTGTPATGIDATIEIDFASNLTVE